MPSPSDYLYEESYICVKCGFPRDLCDCPAPTPMDMWQPYRDAVAQIIPHAQIIVDKYHIVRMANQSMESVRDLTTETKK